jgi:aminomethyltransferase
VNQCYEFARSGTALMDLSSEGYFRVTGPDAENMLNRCFSMDLEIVFPWKGVTGLFLTDSAKLIAIATLFKADDDFIVFTEEKTSESLFLHLQSQFAGSTVHIESMAADYAMLCVLGPQAQNAMSMFGGEDILGLPYLSFEDNAKLDARLFRVGFTGEYEYRILCPRDRRDAMWADFIARGNDYGIGVASAEVMSLLMMEMRSLQKSGLPADADPISLGLHWMVNFRKEDFPGLQVLNSAKELPASRTLMLCLDSPKMAQAGDRLQIDGQDVGYCSSIHYSPTLQKDIGLAHVTNEFGWVGVPFNVVSQHGAINAIGVSAPLFVTKTVMSA